MEGYKTYRHESNPKEKELHDKFIQNNKYIDIERIVFPQSETFVSEHILSEREMKIVISTIQWLGSPVGEGFLRSCGFKLKED